MKKTICLLISIVLLISVVPVAFAAEKSEFTYEKLTDTTIRITGCHGNDTNLVIPSKIDGYTVTEFAATFTYNKAPESIKFADTITSIDTDFRFQRKLKSLVLPKNLKIIPASMCSYCWNLEEVTFPEKLRKIGANAFYNTCLANIDLPDTVTYIGKKAFENCDLSSLTLPKGLKRINAEAFKRSGVIENITIPDSVVTIERSAFSHVHAKSVKIGKGTKTIKPKAFMDNEELESVTVDENNPYYCSVDGVLYTKDMKNLVYYPQHKDVGGSYTIPDSVTKVIGCAFVYSELKDVTVGGNVNEIANKAFKQSEIESVKLNDSLTRIGKEGFKGCYNLKTVELPEGITKIKDRTFGNCYKLESAELPSQLKVIEDEAFYWCENLTELTLPDTVESIGSWAFYDSGITKMTVPNLADYRFRHAFSGMYSLEELTLLNPDADYKRFFSWSVPESLKKVTLGDKNAELEVGESIDVDSYIYSMSGDKNFTMEDNGTVSMDTSSDDHVTVTALAQGETTITMNCGIVSQNIVIKVI